MANRLGLRWFDAGARDDAPVVVSDRVFTAANVISMVRLLGLPLFAWLVLDVGAYGMAVLVAGLTSTTDWVDGYVARRYNQVTKLGRLLDPVIDRALIATVAVVLVLVGFLPWWIAVAVLGRDVLLLGAALVLFGGVPPIPVSRTGKFATACLLPGIPAFLVANMDWADLGQDVFTVLAWTLSLAGVAAYWIAGLQYARAAQALRGRSQRRRDLA